MKFTLIKKVTLCCLITFIVSGCMAKESPSIQPASKNSVSAEINSSFKHVGIFLNAIKNKNKQQLSSLIGANGLIIQREFTSGNRGGTRGKAFIKKYAVSELTNNLGFVVESQTPVDLIWLFPDSSKKSISEIANYPANFPVNFPNATNTDEWLDTLKLMVSSHPEGKDGVPFITVSKDQKIIILTEAQVIDGVLVGALALLAEVNGKFELLYIWDLR